MAVGSVEKNQKNLPKTLIKPIRICYFEAMTNNTNQPITATIAGRDYTIHMDTFTQNDNYTLVRVTGKRGAEGALTWRNNDQYAGRPLIVGIAALQRLNWFEIARDIAHLFPAVAKVIA